MVGILREGDAGATSGGDGECQGSGERAELAAGEFLVHESLPFDSFSEHTLSARFGLVMAWTSASVRTVSPMKLGCS